MKQQSTPRCSHALGVIFLASFFTAMHLQSLLADQQLSSAFLSIPTWKSCLKGMGISSTSMMQSGEFVPVPFFSCFVLISLCFLFCWIAGGLFIGRTKQEKLTTALAVWGIQGWCWWCLLAIWEGVSIALSLLHWDALLNVLRSLVAFNLALVLACWMTTFFTLSQKVPEERALRNKMPTESKIDRKVWLSLIIFVFVFTAMNWQLYHGLWIPHGDSAMYEEHLWNVTHGKGFRSYLDQGLFWGEHVQFFHLFLIPIHWAWPSLLPLEFLETLALGIGVIPIYRMVNRSTSNRHVALLVSISYLLYFPLQFLDIAIDLKTFRPISFGVPLMLFGLERMEQREYKSMLICFLFALTTKEDYALVLSPLGLWMMIQSFRYPVTGSKIEPRMGVSRKENSVKQRDRYWGLGLCLGSFFYLVLVTRVIIPYFRSGEEVHYARYFSQFGSSLPEIVKNLLGKPGLLFSQLGTSRTLLYGIAVLLPLGFAPLFSFSRFLVSVPLLVLLCLNEIATDPRHHFHAPLVPMLFWALAWGLPRYSHWFARLGVMRYFSRKYSSSLLKRSIWSESPGSGKVVNRPELKLAGTILLALSCSTGLFFSLSPLGITFWDKGSRWYWKSLYVPGVRSREFPKVFEQIPLASRVASTDFVHPRFTHHERSYDYSQYKRRVSNYELTVPPDTDFIVIDTTHPYSEIHLPEDVKEFRQHPEAWELLSDRTGGVFILLKRRKPSDL